jgi:hypothetical protein
MVSTPYSGYFSDQDGSFWKVVSAASRAIGTTCRHNAPAPHRQGATVTARDACAKGSRIKGPLTEQPWGDATGYLEDRIGVIWVVSVEKA